MYWSLIIVTLLSCSDPVESRLSMYESQSDCEAAMKARAGVLAPAQHFECRENYHG